MQTPPLSSFKTCLVTLTCINTLPTLHPTRCPWQPPICFVSVDLLFWTFHISGIIQCLSFHVWLLSLSILFTGSNHVVVGVRVSFLFRAESYSIIGMGHVPFIYLLVC